MATIVRSLVKELTKRLSERELPLQIVVGPPGRENHRCATSDGQLARGLPLCVGRFALCSRPLLDSGPMGNRTPPRSRG